MIEHRNSPNGVLIQLTNFCNFKCSHCSQKAPFYVNVEPDTFELSFEEWAKILTRIRRARITQLRFTGGEPFLRKDLELLCRKAFELGFEVSFVTNGSLIIPGNIDWLREIQPKSVWVSIYGFPGKMYENISGTRNIFPRITSTVCRLVEALPEVGIYYPLGSHNYREVGAFIQYFYSLGVRYIKFLQVLEHGRARESREIASLSFEVLKYTLSHIFKSASECTGMRVRVSMLSGQSDLFVSMGFIVPKDRSCHIGLKNLWTITSEGSVHPCCLFMNGSACILFNARSSQEFSKWHRWDRLGVLKLLKQRHAIVRNCPALPDSENSKHKILNDFVCPLTYAEIRS